MDTVSHFPDFGSCRAEKICVSDDIQPTPLAGQSHNLSTLLLQKANLVLLVASDQAQNDYAGFMTL